MLAQNIIVDLFPLHTIVVPWVAWKVSCDEIVNLIKNTEMKINAIWNPLKQVESVLTIC